MKKNGTVLSAVIVVPYHSPEDYEAKKPGTGFKVEFDRVASPAEIAVFVAALSERGFNFTVSFDEGARIVMLDGWSNQCSVPELGNILDRSGFAGVETKPAIRFEYHDITEEYLAGRWVRPEPKKEE